MKIHFNKHFFLVPTILIPQEKGKVGGYGVTEVKFFFNNTLIILFLYLNHNEFEI